jgi:hypothetical protein
MIMVKDGLQYRHIAVRFLPDTISTGAGTVGISTLSFHIDGMSTCLGHDGMPNQALEGNLRGDPSPFEIAKHQEW